MPTGSARRGMTSDLLLTALASLAVLVGNALMASLLAHRGAADVFEPYNVAKRVGAAMLPFVTMGLTVGVVKYVAASSVEERKNAYIAATIGMVLAAVAVVSVAFAVAPELFARFLAGTDDVGFLWAVWAYAIALTANAVVYSFYRSEMRQSLANITSVISMAIIPVTVVILAPQDWVAEEILYLVSALIIVWNLGQLGVRLARTAATGMRLAGLAGRASELLAYSLPRVPAGIAMGALLAVGPVLARRSGDTRTSAYLLAGLAVAQIASASLQAFGIVLLPRVSELDAKQDHKTVATLIQPLLSGAMILAAVVTPLAIGLAPDIVPVWLGVEFEPAVRTVQVVALSIPGVIMYNILRSVTDGVERRPVNTYAAIAGLLCAVGLMLILPGDSSEAYAAAYVIGQLVVGATVLAIVVRVLDIRVRASYVLKVALVSSIAGILLGSVSASAAGMLAIEVIVAVTLLFAMLVGALWYAPERDTFRSAIRRIVRLPSA